STSAHVQGTLRDRLQSLGRIEGRNLSIEPRYGEGDATRLLQLAQELVRLKVDLIVAGSTPAALAAKEATSTIPIVVVMGGDPVARGLASSMSHPGGNITGVTALVEELSGKRIQLFKEAVPNLRRVAFLSDPAFPDNQSSVRALAQGAKSLGVRL